MEQYVVKELDDIVAVIRDLKDPNNDIHNQISRVFEMDNERNRLGLDPLIDRPSIIEMKEWAKELHIQNL